MHIQIFVLIKKSLTLQLENEVNDSSFVCET